ncbi:C_GCAxxG_C_C family probable redox protein [Desulfohalotomaculum tongense]|uniref:DVU_1555 family C-GCAxxG-C-C protein n=1 Tax=Desulforadius tongensis TaxID=1216062 RepID=UPI00195C3B47|nr:DV_1555 family C-GCAxxG-C-C protein [Desulforadius tongensis]MBM7855077.1 C_GCAxxG_C_C family probable redox protein [Desulforadius tongensis]
MSEAAFRMFELAQQGFKCSQILLMLGLERQGKENPDLIRAGSGLAGGLGFCGKICGALTGGVCLLGLYAGRGKVNESENPQLNVMVDQLVSWFEEQFGSNGINCTDILGGDPKQKIDAVKCGNIVAATYSKVQAILADQGINTAGEGR